VDLGAALVEAFLTNERVNQVLLDLIEPALWRVFPPSSPRRNVATTFCHIHNVRCMRLQMSRRSLPGARLPRRLERGSVTIAAAREALRASAEAMARLIEAALAAGGHVADFRPDVVAMTCAAIVHEAHHRGQVTHWLRELGKPIPIEKAAALWLWDQRWREVPER
jgi:uncharacterized damage-inducible protein DinB